MCRRVLAIVVMALVGSLLAVTSASALTVEYNGSKGWAQVSASKLPPGASPFVCLPSAKHPRAVILLHGTFGDMSDTWQALAPLLYNEGFCVYTFNYGSVTAMGQSSGSFGIYGVGDIVESAEQLSVDVNEILKATNTSKVDIVGHSQGGMMPRYYIKYLGGASKVHTLVGLAPSNHGTTATGLSHMASSFGVPGWMISACTACFEQEVGSGSTFLSKLNSGGDTVAGVNYTVIASSKDGVIIPYTSSFLTGSKVTNITLQEQCALDEGDHMSMPYDHIADNDVFNALDPAEARSARCTPIFPYVGG